MDEHSQDRNDRKIRIPRVIAALLVPFLLAAGLILFTLPGRTEEFFAWTIQPVLTPLLMGAGYLSGAYFFIRAAFEKEWEAVRLGFLPITVFAWLSAAATLIHWDRFNHSHITFYAWVALYAITPVLVPAIWWMNHSNPSFRKGGPEDISTPVAYALGIAGVLTLLSGLGLFITPELLIPVWPWTLTPFTARVIGSWFVLPGLVDLGIAVNRRWRNARLVLESQLLGLVLILIGLMRGSNDLHLDNPLAWGFIAAISLLALGLLLVYVSRRRNGQVGELKTSRR